jgi:signal transduction histidine kinase
MDLAPLPPVACYPGKVNQVVLNLLANAIDACPSGGRVSVRTRAGPDGVELHVLDTGHGIDPAIRDRIFDPFFTTKPVGQGTGLGLSISYGIVQAHGGSITVESTPGRGTHFVVRLPSVPSPADPPSP